MQNFKKLFTSCLVLGALSSGAYAQDIKFGVGIAADDDKEFSLKGSNDDYKKIHVYSSNEDTTLVNIMETDSDILIEIEAAGSPLRYTNADNTNNRDENQFVATDDVTLIGKESDVVDKGAVRIHNLKAGELKENGNQAVNTGQLFQTNQNLSKVKTDLATTDSNVESLKKNAEANKQEIDELGKRADDNDSKFEEVRKGFEAVHNNFVTNDKATKDGFERVGSVIQELAQSTDKNIADTNTKIAEADKKIVETDEKVNTVTAAFEGLKSTHQAVQQENGKKFAALGESVKVTNTKLESVAATLNQQLDEAKGRVAALTTQVNGHDVQLKSLDKKVAQVDKKAQQGIAAALAVAAIPQAVLPNESVVAFGAGNWRSENGVAIGFSHASGNGKWLFKVGAVNAGSNYGANAGVGYRW
ncbi:Autotransporter adhesin [Pasteurella testudinis DSM 23072]|uniref:Autotransporter adhesin n=1 Tax=Pasteurella testudinis DSM 23072 TaxID=1122938 RepID=A0A1W1V446_9PAST|nr:YadA-like family protein [Pasteurella testudinis]SMB88102.1 Autotransporter adhesin [Pasteurella testudinis DSM 23072]SUB51203.1 autotransporter adhesin [Pasteurella testudinis]